MLLAYHDVGGLDKAEILFPHKNCSIIHMYAVPLRRNLAAYTKFACPIDDRDVKFHNRFYSKILTVLAATRTEAEGSRAYRLACCGVKGLAGDVLEPAVTSRRAAGAGDPITSCSTTPQHQHLHLQSAFFYTQSVNL